ncbi:MAG: hypothetical protein QM784_22570 [Polyangiaceae bacterium]
MKPGVSTRAGVLVPAPRTHRGALGAFGNSATNVTTNAAAIQVGSLRLRLPDVEPERAKALTERALEGALERVSARFGARHAPVNLGGISLRLTLPSDSSACTPEEHERALEQALEQALVSALSRSNEEE